MTVPKLQEQKDWLEKFSFQPPMTAGSRHGRAPTLPTQVMSTDSPSYIPIMQMPPRRFQ